MLNPIRKGFIMDDAHKTPAKHGETSAAQRAANVSTGSEPISSGMGKTGEPTTQEGAQTGEGKKASAQGHPDAELGKQTASQSANGLQSGDMRLADRITIRVRGDSVTLMLAGDPHEKSVTGAELASLIESKYWDD